MGTVFTAMLSEQSTVFRNLVSRKNFWIVLLDIVFIVFANLLSRIAAGNNVEASATCIGVRTRKVVGQEIVEPDNGMKDGIFRNRGGAFSWDNDLGGQASDQSG